MQWWVVRGKGSCGSEGGGADPADAEERELGRWDAAGLRRGEVWTQLWSGVVWWHGGVVLVHCWIASVCSAVLISELIIIIINIFH